MGQPLATMVTFSQPSSLKTSEQHGAGTVPA